MSTTKEDGTAQLKKSMNPNQKYIIPQQRNKNFTKHAHVRKEQRHISDNSIQKLEKEGKTIINEDGGAVLVDKDTQMVKSKDGVVITVLENKRNTRYDALQISKEKEEKLLKEVQKNNDFAMCELAELYLNGDLGNRDVKKAENLLLKAAKKRNSHAMCLLAQFYERGELGKPDLIESNAWLEKAAERNNKYALAILGQKYLAEYLEKKSKKEWNEAANIVLKNTIISYLERSAKKGGTRAMWQLAKIHEDGLLGKKDVKKAIEIYSKAARIGSPASLDSLNNLVAKGELNVKIFDSILEEASLLIAKTSSNLAVEIGTQQVLGLLGSNPERGLQMLEEAGKNRNIEAIKTLIKCYRLGKGCKIDLNHANHWFKTLEKLCHEAAEKGNLETMIELAELYLEGKLCDIDLKKSEEYYKMAAATNDVNSIFQLGKYYLTKKFGQSPTEGKTLIEKAIQLWKKQANLGDIEAITSLYEIYLDEELGLKNYSKALPWLLLAVGRQEQEAMITLAELHFEKDFQDEIKNIPTKKYHEWINKLKELLNKHCKTEYEAAALLGKMYHTGTLLNKDLSQAAKWLCHASSLPGSSSKINNEFMQFLNNDKWDIPAKAQILQGLLELAELVKDESHYKVARVLGDIYCQGKLAAKDYKKGISWYEKAAKLGNSVAMYELGMLYQSGCLGQIDFTKAIDWFIQSAKAENEKSIQQLIELSKQKDLKDEYKKLIEPWIKVVSEPMLFAFSKEKTPIPVTKSMNDVTNDLRIPRDHLGKIKK